jgi:hypothetical protein
MEEIGLTEAIAELRDEVARAVLAGSSQDLRFEVGEITMTFEVAIERAVEGKGGIKFWVVEASGGASQSTTKTHTLTIPLTPRRRDGSPILTGDDVIPN